MSLAHLLIFFVLMAASTMCSDRVFKIEGDSFTKDGEPFRVISGSIHYFRIHPSLWADRLIKAKYAGLNAVQFYIPWNLHQPQPGSFQFEGFTDVVEFVRLAQQIGLLVILRPGPYICAEWEGGGLPYWLLNAPKMHVRTGDPDFIDAMDAYFDVLLPKFAGLTYAKGGPIIMAQVENEYGSFGSDKVYLGHVRDRLRLHLPDVLLYSTDGPELRMLKGAHLPDVYSTVDFGPDFDMNAAFQLQRQVQPHGPLMCSEFYTGWLDHWGDKHATVSTAAVATALDKILALNASVHFYMFHGGTNFGFMNGANLAGDDTFQPTTTSYDYDAPLTEGGRVTDKFQAIRQVISKYTQLPPLDPALLAKWQLSSTSYGQVNFTQSIDFFSALPLLAPVSTPHVNAPSMESLNQAYGFVVYRSVVSGPAASLVIDHVGDRAQVYLDKKYQGTIGRGPKATHSVKLPLDDNQTADLDILVENCGRINYGPSLFDSKGILSNPRMDYQYISNWTVFSLPLNDLSVLKDHFSSNTSTAGPIFYRGIFTISGTDLQDTYLQLQGFTKGVAYVNGFNLGRYDHAGPQQTLYIPGPLLEFGNNELIVFELLGTSSLSAQLVAEPIFTARQPLVFHSHQMARF